MKEIEGEFDEETKIDIVELPPDNGDIVSDEENIDENDLGDICLLEVTGHLELHSNAF